MSLKDEMNAFNVKPGPITTVPRDAQGEWKQRALDAEDKFDRWVSGANEALKAMRAERDRYRKALERIRDGGGSTSWPRGIAREALKGEDG